MTYVFGNKCMWQKKRRIPVEGVGFAVETIVHDCEWVHMTKVSPPPKRPWEWCGKTHIFPEWQEREQEITAYARTFTVGDRVHFTIRDTVLYGVVVGRSRKSAKVYVDSRKETWNVGYGHVRKD
jgi:hypothetical protein